jgi:hypothetical protein
LQIYNESGNWWRVAANLGCLLLVLPLTMMKNMSALRKIGFVGVVSVTFNMIAVVLVSFRGYNDENRGIFYVDVSKINWFTYQGLETVSLLAQGMASILFCFISHQILFFVKNLRQPTERRFNSLIKRVHLIELFAFALIGISAYLLLI